jgi:hypothetical protein
MAEVTVLTPACPAPRRAPDSPDWNNTAVRSGGRGNGTRQCARDMQRAQGLGREQRSPVNKWSQQSKTGASMFCAGWRLPSVTGFASRPYPLCLTAPLFPLLPLLRLPSGPVKLVGQPTFSWRFALRRVGRGMVVVALDLPTPRWLVGPRRLASIASFGGSAGMRQSQPMAIRSARPVCLRASGTVK